MREENSYIDVSHEKRARASRLLKGMSDAAAAKFFDVPEPFVNLARSVSWYCPSSVVLAILAKPVLRVVS